MGPRLGFERFMPLASLEPRTASSPAECVINRVTRPPSLGNYGKVGWSEAIRRFLHRKIDGVLIREGVFLEEIR